VSRWFRHYAGMMRDDKLVRVAIRSKQTIERVVWVYAAILESAAEIDDAGRYDLDAAEASYFLRADETDVVGILRELEVAGRIASGCVVKWGNRQFQSDRSADRVARHRAKKRQDNVGDDRGNGVVTLHERQRNAPETELETDTDISEAKASSPRPWALPVGVNLQTWTDFLTNRKRKRLVNTASTWKTFQDDLTRISAQTGIPPPKLIELCTGKGWGGIYDPTEDKGNGQQRTNGMGRNQSDGLSSTARAAVAVFGAPGARH
jgi:hypothetical protein